MSHCESTDANTGWTLTAVAVDARELAALAVAVLSEAAGAAEATGRQGVEDDLVTDLDIGHTVTNLVDPAGVLMANRVWKLDVGLLRPLSLENVNVGSAHAC